MEGHCSTGQSPQWAVVPMEEEEGEEEEEEEEGGGEEEEYNVRLQAGYIWLKLASSGGLL